MARARKVWRLSARIGRRKAIRVFEVTSTLPDMTKQSQSRRLSSRPYPKSLSRQLTLTAVATTLLFGASILLGLTGLHSVETQLTRAQQAYQQRVASLQAISHRLAADHREIADLYHQARAGAQITQHVRQWHDLMDKTGHALDRVKTDWLQFRGLRHRPADENALNRVDQYLPQCRRGLQAILHNISDPSGDLGPAAALQNSTGGLCVQTLGALSRLTDREMTLVGKFYTDATEDARHHQSTLFLLGAVTLLLAGLFSLSLLRRMYQGLRRLQQTAGALAGGDLSPLETDTVRDEIGQVLDNMATMRNRLLRMVEDARAREAETRRIAAMYALQSGINQLILRVQDPGQLLSLACTMAAQRGEFMLVWIGCPIDDGRQLQVRAWAGQGESYLASNAVTTLAGTDNPEPAARAFQENRPVICHSFEAPSTGSGWQSQALEQGYEAAASFPLTVNNQPWGVISFYVSAPHFFNEEQRALCREIAGDIGLALSFWEQNERRSAAEEQIRRYDTIRRRAQEVAHLGTWFQDNETGLLSLSEEACRLFGLSEGDSLAPEALLKRIHPLDRNRVASVWQKSSDGDRKRVEFRVQWESAIKWLELQWHDLSTDEAKLMLGTLQDVTERRNHEDELIKLSQAIEQSVNAVVITDLDHRIEYVNQAFVRTTGYGKAEVLGQTPKILRSGETPLKAYAELREHLARGESWTGEFVNRRKDGSTFTEVAQISPVRQANGVISHYMAVKEDVTEKRKNQAKLAELAFYDPLTGLPNRASFQSHFNDQIQRAGQSGQALALVLMGMNRLKEINDTQGHKMGDSVLTEMAARLAGSLQPGTFLARLHGDEFVVVAPIRNKPDAISLAESLAETITPRLRIGSASFQMRVSMGISVFPDDATSPNQMLRYADIAMHRAKAEGLVFQLYEPELQARISRQVEIAQRLASALEENRLQIYFQPQVMLDGQSLSGAEVLLRWHEPDWGWISPGEFIPIAEERGMMVAIGNWVLTRACGQLREWRDSGYDFKGRVAINVSAQQLDQPDFQDHLLATVAGAGLSPGDIELEITESGAMRHPEKSIECARWLTEAGFVLAIDDFGTGYSSLTYLKRFAAKVLKIDQSFVRDMLTDHNDHSIVVTTIGIAHSLGMDTLAEGVEQPEQARELASLGCEQAQGFLYDRALPPAEFAGKWLGRGHRS